MSIERMELARDVLQDNLCFSVPETYHGMTTLMVGDFLGRDDGICIDMDAIHWLESLGQIPMFIISAVRGLYFKRSTNSAGRYMHSQANLYSFSIKVK
jgi:hypothetical protein